jgi:hypothetical protein
MPNLIEIRQVVSEMKYANGKGKELAFCPTKAKGGKVSSVPKHHATRACKGR